MDPGTRSYDFHVLSGGGNSRKDLVGCSGKDRQDFFGNYYEAISKFGIAVPIFLATCVEGFGVESLLCASHERLAARIDKIKNSMAEAAAI